MGVVNQQRSACYAALARGSPPDIFPGRLRRVPRGRVFGPVAATRPPKQPNTSRDIAVILSRSPLWHPSLGLLHAAAASFASSIALTFPFRYADLSLRSSSNDQSVTPTRLICRNIVPYRHFHFSPIRKRKHVPHAQRHLRHVFTGSPCVYLN